MGEIHKRPLKVRAMGKGKQITVPVEAMLEVGDRTTVFYNSFMVVVPAGSHVDEAKLREAIVIPEEK